MKRRTLLTLSGAAMLACPRILRAEALPDLEAEARALAERPFVAPDLDLPPPFDALDYDSYRAIRPRPDRGALDLGGGIRAQLLPRGWLHRQPVAIHPPGARAPHPFAAADFDFDDRYFPTTPEDPEFEASGFSGLRLTGPLNRPDRAEEIAVFQGASYFRALARNTVYGLSARVLGLGTGGPEPEEFPAITRLHLARVEEDGAIPMGALVDSPRASAAFFVRIHPGAPTAMDCRLVLFPRAELTDAGIAPLTSMFFFGPMGPSFADDFRPAVHDNDVLWMQNGAGETLWRPLANPARVEMSAFIDDGPRAFGLLQSPRAFADFEDAEATYHRRPQAWVEPEGDWGEGAVHLLEIPTRDEYADNIVAFWRPAVPLRPGRAHRFAYRLTWSADAPKARHPLTPIRSASGIEPVAREGRLFVIDFATDGAHGPLPDPATLSLSATVTDGGGAMSGATLYALAEADRLRASFVFTPEPGARAAELRVTLAGPDGALAAPVWLFRWTPARDPTRP